MTLDHAHGRAALLALLVALTGCGPPAAPITDAGPSTEITDAGAPGSSRDAGAPPRMDPSGAFEVTSDDGLATLRVPAGALPEGVAPEELGVTALPPAPGAEVAHYALTPDGTVFSVPVELEVSYPAGPGELIFATIANGDAVEPVDLDALTRDAAGEVTGFTASIPHFTDFKASSTSVGFRVETTQPPPDVPVGRATTIESELEAPDQVEIDVTIPQVAANGDVTNQIHRWRWDLPDGASPAGAYTTSGALPAGRRITLVGNLGLATRKVTGSSSWLCQRAGAFIVHTDAEVSVPLRYTIDGEDRGGGAGLVVLPQLRSLGFCEERVADATRDYLGPYMGAPASYAAGHVDITTTSAALVDDPALLAELHAQNGCGAHGPSREVVCAADAPLEGPVWVFSMTLAGLPEEAEPGISLAYGVSLESNGDPRDDWEAVDPESYDLNVGTDRWYQVGLEPAAGLSALHATQVDAEQSPHQTETLSRVIVDGATVRFLVPASEIPAETPAYRMMAFGYDGLRADVFGADVSGGPYDPPVAIAR